MKIISSNKKYFLVATIAILIGLSAGYIYLTNQDPTKKYSPKYETKTSKNTSDSTQSKDEHKVAAPANNLPATSNDVPSSSSGSITITELSQTDGFINISVSLSNFTATTCVYQFISDGARPITKQVSDCGAVSVPQAEFEKIGVYAVTAVAYSNKDKITSESRELNVK